MFWEVIILNAMFREAAIHVLPTRLWTKMFYRLDVTFKYLIEIERHATGIKLNYRFQSGKLSLSVAVKRKTFSAKFSLQLLVHPGPFY